jgi:hypothetical protein
MVIVLRVGVQRGTSQMRREKRRPERNEAFSAASNARRGEPSSASGRFVARPLIDNVR